MQVNPYLFFDGQCVEAFHFYEQALGGKLEALMTYGDLPEGTPVPPGAKDRALHARLSVGSQALMGSDCPPGEYQPPQGFSVALQIDQAAEARRIFDALAADGTVTAPFGQTFFSAGGFGMLVDRYGTSWMINCEQAA